VVGRPQDVSGRAELREKDVLRGGGHGQHPVRQNQAVGVDELGKLREDPRAAEHGIAVKASSHQGIARRINGQPTVPDAGAVDLGEGGLLPGSGAPHPLAIAVGIVAGEEQRGIRPGTDRMGAEEGGIARGRARQVNPARAIQRQRARGVCIIPARLAQPNHLAVRGVFDEEHVTRGKVGRRIGEGRAAERHHTAEGARDEDVSRSVRHAGPGINRSDRGIAAIHGAAGRMAGPKNFRRALLCLDLGCDG